MSETETNADASSDEQRLLSHLAEHLFHEMGGDLAVETLHLRATDHLDIDAEAVQKLTEDGAEDGIYQIERETTPPSASPTSNLSDRHRTSLATLLASISRVTTMSRQISRNSMS